VNSWQILTSFRLEFRRVNFYLGIIIFKLKITDIKQNNKAYSQYDYKPEKKFEKIFIK